MRHFIAFSISLFIHIVLVTILIKTTTPSILKYGSEFNSKKIDLSIFVSINENYITKPQPNKSIKKITNLNNIKKESQEELSTNIFEKKTKKIRQVKTLISKNNSDEINKAQKRTLIKKNNLQNLQQVRLNNDLVNKSSYISQLQKKIAIKATRFYPLRAQRKKQQGIVTVGFNIAKDGTFFEIRLIKSSGFKSLDNAALNTLKKIQKFRSRPINIPKSFIIPIYFKL